MKKLIFEMFGLALSIVAIGLIISLAISTRPKSEMSSSDNQLDIAQLLEKRLKQLDVSVINVKIARQSPLQIEIVLQSPVDNNFIGREDHWNEFIARREAELANVNYGSHIESFIITVLNKDGKNIYSSETYLYPERPSQKYNPGSPSSVDRFQTKNILDHSFDSGNLKLQSMDVSTKYSDDWNSKLVTMELSTGTDSYNDAEPLVTDFILNIKPQMEAINTQYNTRIAIVWAKVYDANGNIIVDYMEDIALGTQIFWVADNFHGGWYSEPAPAASAIPTIITTPVSTNAPVPPGKDETPTPTMASNPKDSGPYPSPYP